MNENPMHRRLEDRLAAQKAGKSCRIVVPGDCKVCHRRRADVPATPQQVIDWFEKGSTEGFKKYEVRMLKEGLHRECQPVADARAKGKKVPAPPRNVRKVPTVVQDIIDIAERAHMQKVLDRRAAKAV